MQKLVVFAIFAVSAWCVVLSAPLEEGNAAAKEIAANKANSSNASTAPKLNIGVAPEPYYWYYPTQPQPMVVVQRSPPIIAGGPQSGYLQYTLGKSAEEKTFGHLNRHRPLLYERPQYYSAPVQTYSVPVASYGYSQPAYYHQPTAYVSYSYPTQAGHYYRDNRNQHPQQPAAFYPSDYSSNYAVRPQLMRMIADDGISNIISPSPKSNDYSQIDDLQKDIIIDDQFNMQIKPNYLLDRVHLERPNPQSLFSRDAEQSSYDTLQGLDGQSMSQVPPVNPEDQVYVVMNRYDNVQGGGARVSSGRSADESSWYYPHTLSDPQTYGSLPSNIVSAAGSQPFEIAPSSASLKYGNRAPFSPENIQTLMHDFYAQQLRQLPASKTGSSRSEDGKSTSEALAIFLKQYQALQSAEFEGRNAKDQSKSVVKIVEMKNEEKLQPNEKTDKPKQSQTMPSTS